MVRAAQHSLPPHLLCLRLQSHLQLPSKHPGVFTGAAENVHANPPHPCHLAAVRIDAKRITPPVTAASL